MIRLQRPEVEEYDPKFQKYLDLVPDGPWLKIFQENAHNTYEIFGALTEEKQMHRYAEGKWTPKDMLLHIIDTERVMSYRALVAARGDSSSPLPSVNEDLYAANAGANDRTMPDLLAEFGLVRAGIEALFAHITEEQSKFKGNGVSHPITSRALAFIIIGHNLHHLEVLKNRYL